MSQSYHCSLSEIRPASDTRDFGPYRNEAELVQMTGLTYAEWSAHQPLIKAAEGRAPRHHRSSCINRLIE